MEILIDNVYPIESKSRRSIRNFIFKSVLIAANITQYGTTRRFQNYITTISTPRQAKQIHCHHAQDYHRTILRHPSRRRT